MDEAYSGNQKKKKKKKRGRGNVQEKRKKKWKIKEGRGNIQTKKKKEKKRKRNVLNETHVQVHMGILVIYLSNSSHLVSFLFWKENFW